MASAMDCSIVSCSRCGKTYRGAHQLQKHVPHCHGITKKKRRLGTSPSTTPVGTDGAAKELPQAEGTPVVGGNAPFDAPISSNSNSDGSVPTPCVAFAGAGAADSSPAAFSAGGYSSSTNGASTSSTEHFASPHQQQVPMRKATQWVDWDDFPPGGDTATRARMLQAATLRREALGSRDADPTEVTMEDFVFDLFLKSLIPKQQATQLLVVHERAVHRRLCRHCHAVNTERQAVKDPIGQMLRKRSKAEWPNSKEHPPVQVQHLEAGDVYTACTVISDLPVELAVMAQEVPLSEFIESSHMAPTATADEVYEVNDSSMCLDLRGRPLPEADINEHLRALQEATLANMKQFLNDAGRKDVLSQLKLSPMVLRGGIVNEERSLWESTRRAVPQPEKERVFAQASHGTWSCQAAGMARLRGKLLLPLKVYMDEVAPDSCGAAKLYPVALTALLGSNAQVRCNHRTVLASLPMPAGHVTDSADEKQAYLQEVIMECVLKPLERIRQAGGVPVLLDEAGQELCREHGIDVVAAHDGTKYAMAAAVVTQISADFVEAWNTLTLKHMTSVSCTEKFSSSSKWRPSTCIGKCTPRDLRQGKEDPDRRPKTAEACAWMQPWAAPLTVADPTQLRPADFLHVGQKGPVGDRIEDVFIAAVGAVAAKQHMSLLSRGQGATVDGARLYGTAGSRELQPLSARMVRGEERTSRVLVLPLGLGTMKESDLVPERWFLLQALVEAAIQIHRHVLTVERHTVMSLASLAGHCARLALLHELLGTLISGPEHFKAYPKLHAVLHIARDIARFGSVGAMDTDAGEGQHIALVRTWRRTRESKAKDGAMRRIRIMQKALMLRRYTALGAPAQAPAVSSAAAPADACCADFVGKGKVEGESRLGETDPVREAELMTHITTHAVGQRWASATLTHHSGNRCTLHFPVWLTVFSQNEFDDAPGIPLTYSVWLFRAVAASGERGEVQVHGVFVDTVRGGVAGWSTLIEGSCEATPATIPWRAVVGPAVVRRVGAMDEPPATGNARGAMWLPTLSNRRHVRTRPSSST